MRRGWKRDLAEAERLAADGHLANAAAVLQRLEHEARVGYESRVKQRIDETRARISAELSELDRAHFDRRLASHTGNGDVEEAVEVSPIGFALALIGAIAMLIAIFLPYADESGFARIRDNSLIQSGDGWVFLGLAIAGSVAVLRAKTVGRRTAAPIVFGLIGIVFAIYIGTSDDALQLCPADSSLGIGCEKASPGTGVYVAGVAALLMLIGGSHIWRASVAGPVATTATPERSIDGGEKTCPDCAETIKAAARVCRYCGHRFDNEASEPTLVPPQQS
jgi:hypothetical protein